VQIKVSTVSEIFGMLYTRVKASGYLPRAMVVVSFRIHAYFIVYAELARLRVTMGDVAYPVLGFNDSTARSTLFQSLAEMADSAPSSALSAFRHSLEALSLLAFTAR
jgi:hypothetical protein